MGRSNQRIVIIGAGIIGVSSALELLKQGHKVTLIDRNEPGLGCSYGNAGWLTPCFALPLPQPGMLLKSIGWLIDPQSPLYIKPQPSFLLLQWLSRFLFSMNETHLQKSVKALVDLSLYSLKSYEALHKSQPNGIGFSQKGLLMVAQSKSGLNSIQKERDLVSKHGIPGDLLDATQCRSLEPALTGSLLGGVYFTNEAHAEPYQTVLALTDACRKIGADILDRTEVFDFNILDGKISGLRTTHGEISGDQYVLATGSWSYSLAKKLALNIPILGGKGYAVITKELLPSPKIPLMLTEKKIAVTPRDQSVRLAGTLELVNQDESITKKRLDAIVSGARQYLTLPDPLTVTEVWRGLRPCSPDGVPIMGYSPRHQNLIIATGHQMLGFQTGLGSGRFIADLISGNKTQFDEQAFRVNRF